MVLGFAVAIYRLIFEWDNNKNDLLSVLVVNPGGLAIYGGVLGGVVVALIYRKEKPIWALHSPLISQVLSGYLIIFGIVTIFIICKRKAMRQ